jgi:hypothetical protein
MIGVIIALMVSTIGLFVGCIILLRELNLIYELIIQRRDKELSSNELETALFKLIYKG